MLVNVSETIGYFTLLKMASVRDGSLEDLNDENFRMHVGHAHVLTTLSLCVLVSAQFYQVNSAFDTAMKIKVIVERIIIVVPNNARASPRGGCVTSARTMTRPESIVNDAPVKAISGYALLKANIPPNSANANPTNPNIPMNQSP